MSAPTWLAFLAACAVGAPTRYLLEALIQRRHSSGPFPRGTWTVNITGCFFMGILMGMSVHHGLGLATTTVLGTGFLGSYTTFSTFTVQTALLASGPEARTAVRYIVSSVTMGCVAAGAGFLLVGL